MQVPKVSAAAAAAAAFDAVQFSAQFCRRALIFIIEERLRCAAPQSGDTTRFSSVSCSSSSLPLRGRLSSSKKYRVYFEAFFETSRHSQAKEKSRENFEKQQNLFAPSSTFTK